MLDTFCARLRWCVYGKPRSLEPLESVEVYNSPVDHVEHFGVYGDH